MEQAAPASTQPPAAVQDDDDDAAEIYSQAWRAIYGHYGVWSGGINRIALPAHRAQVVWSMWAHNVAAWEVQHRPQGVCTGEAAHTMYACCMQLSVATSSYTVLEALPKVSMPLAAAAAAAAALLRNQHMSAASAGAHETLHAIRQDAQLRVLPVMQGLMQRPQAMRSGEECKPWLSYALLWGPAVML